MTEDKCLVCGEDHAYINCMTPCENSYEKAIELKKEKEEWMLRCAEWQDVNTELEEEVDRLKGAIRIGIEDIRNIYIGAESDGCVGAIRRLERALKENPRPEPVEEKRCFDHSLQLRYRVTIVDKDQCLKCRENE